MTESKPQKVDLRALYNRSYAGQYLTSVQIDRPVAVKIASLQTDTVKYWQKGAKPAERVVLKFEGKDQGMVVNKTNFKKLAEMFGWDSDGWVGKEITLATVQKEAFGRIVDSIEVRSVAPGVQTAKKDSEGEIKVGRGDREPGDPEL